MLGGMNMVRVRWMVGEDVSELSCMCDPYADKQRQGGGYWSQFRVVVVQVTMSSHHGW